VHQIVVGEIHKFLESTVYLPLNFINFKLFITTYIIVKNFYILKFVKILEKFQ